VEERRVNIQHGTLTGPSYFVKYANAFFKVLVRFLVLVNWTCHGQSPCLASVFLKVKERRAESPAVSKLCEMCFRLCCENEIGELGIINGT